MNQIPGGRIGGFGSARRGLGLLAACTLLAMACSGGEGDGTSADAGSASDATELPAAAPAPGEPALSVEERRAVLDQARAGSDQGEPGTAVDSGSPSPDGSVDAVEVPEPILATIKSDLAQRALASAGDIAVISAEPQEWPDGSLGCPVPGESYMQMITTGYRIVLAIGDKQYDYRATEQGQFVLCDGGKRLPPAADQIQGEAPTS